MSDAEPLGIAPEEELLARWERRIGDIPLGAMTTTERLLHDLGYEVRRLREEKVAHVCRQMVAQHGTRSKYVRGCRCDECKSAESEYRTAQRKKRVIEGLPEGDARHGTYYGYARWHCRCDFCRQANRDQKRRKRENA